jgi:hypothetical protein
MEGNAGIDVTGDMDEDVVEPQPVDQARHLENGCRLRLPCKVGPSATRPPTNVRRYVVNVSSPPNDVDEEQKWNNHQLDC